MPETAHEIAADRSPSPMSLIRAPGGADLGDQPLVPRPLQDDHGDVADPPPQRFRDAAQVLGGRLADVDLARDHGPHAQLLHVGVRRVGQPTRLRRGEDGDRAALAVGDQVRAFQRVDGDVDRRYVLAPRS